jgi:hypothetical protein
LTKAPKLRSEVPSRKKRNVTYKKKKSKKKKTNKDHLYLHPGGEPIKKKVSKRREKK